MGGDGRRNWGATAVQACGCVKGRVLPTTLLPAPAAQGPMSNGWPDVTVRISAWLSNKENNGAGRRDTPQLHGAAAGTPIPWVGVESPTPWACGGGGVRWGWCQPIKMHPIESFCSQETPLINPRLPGSGYP